MFLILENFFYFSLKFEIDVGFFVMKVESNVNYIKIIKIFQNSNEQNYKSLNIFIMKYDVF